MIELLPALTTALAQVSKLKEISDKIKHAELKSLIADLTMQLADVKIGMADLLEENDALKRQLKGMENADGDPCPSCKRRTYFLESSNPHHLFGEVGGVDRKYLCSSCQFTETTLVMPNKR